MTQGFATSYRSPKRLIAMVLLVFLVLTCIALVVSAQSLRDRIDSVRAAESDNVGWLVSQLDVDFKATRLAAKSYMIGQLGAPGARGDTVGFDDVRLKFDIFYSRVETVAASLSRYDTPARLDRLLSDLLTARAQLADRIDSMQSPDATAASQLIATLEEWASLVRDVTTMALQFHVGLAREARAQEQAHLQRFWTQSLILLGFMIGASVLALHLWRELEAHAARTQRASGTITKAIEATLSAVVVTDPDGHILMANAAATEIFRVDRDDMLGRTIGDVMVPDHLRAQHEAGMQRFRATGQKKIVGQGPVRLDAKRADGSGFRAEVSIAADTDLDGNPIMIGFIRDISDIVAAENKLRKARDEAQRHAEAKTMFLATMSHEMRTPLHGVTASLDLINPDHLPPADRDLLHTAQDCSDRALRQINDVLDITRLGERRDDSQVFVPARIARDIASELLPLAREGGNVLSLQITGAPAATAFMGSPDAFSRVLYNLLGNAMKFTRDGRIDLLLDFAANEGGDGALKVRVRDTGPGIAPEDQERIFREFETGAPGDLFGPQGTGLGLPIARIAAQHLGGTLSLDSAPDKGSTFHVDIPLRPAPEAAQQADGHLPAETAEVSEGSAPRPALDILVVDDSDVNLKLMCETVRRLGHRPHTACNGQEAIDAAARAAFDVILMDVSMPVMGGAEATRHIRRAGPSQGAYIAAVTAVSEPERTVELYAAGMNSVVVKPARSADIARLLDVAAETRGMAAQPATAGAGPQDAGDAGASPGHRDCDKALASLTPLFGAGKARELIAEALAEIPQDMLQGARLGDVHAGLAEQLHKAAGATAVVGLTALSEHLVQAEKAAEQADLPALDAQRLEITARARSCQQALEALADG